MEGHAARLMNGMAGAELVWLEEAAQYEESRKRQTEMSKPEVPHLPSNGSCQFSFLNASQDQISHFVLMFGHPENLPGN